MPRLDTDETRPYGEMDTERACIWVHLTEQQAEDLASGYVSTAVKSVIRELLDYAEEDERRAARPVTKRRPKR